MQVIIDIPDAYYNELQTLLDGLDPKTYLLNVTKEVYVQKKVNKEGTQVEQTARQNADTFTVA